MPSGKIHINYWRKLWPLAICVAVAIGYFVYWYSGLFIFGLTALWGVLIGYFLGYYIDPDWDEASITDGEGRMIKIPLIGVFLYGVSSVYGAIFRRHHRSFFTHFPFVSTLIRLVFIFWWLILLYWYKIVSYSELQGYFWLGLWIGLSIADYVHYFLDMNYKSNKFKIRKWSFLS